MANNLSAEPKNGRHMALPMSNKPGLSNITVVVTLPTLRGDTNYNQWAATFKRYFQAEGQWTIVNGEEPEPDKYRGKAPAMEDHHLEVNGAGSHLNPAWEAWSLRNSKANFIMFSHLAPAIQQNFAVFEDARGLWEILAKFYQGKSKQWC